MIENIYKDFYELKNYMIENIKNEFIEYYNIQSKKEIKIINTDKNLSTIFSKNTYIPKILFKNNIYIKKDDFKNFYTKFLKSEYLILKKLFEIFKCEIDKRYKINIKTKIKDFDINELLKIISNNYNESEKYIKLNLKYLTTIPNIDIKTPMKLFDYSQLILNNNFSFITVTSINDLKEINFFTITSIKNKILFEYKDIDYILFLIFMWLSKELYHIGFSKSLLNIINFEFYDTELQKYKWDLVFKHPYMKLSIKKYKEIIK